jgi:hypothetical protein
MMDRFSRKSKRPMTASAGANVPGGSPTTPEAILRRTEDWQTRVLAYAGAVPEAIHAGMFVSNTTSNIDIRVTGDEQIGPMIENMLSPFPMSRVCTNLFYVGEVLVAFDKRNFRWQSFGKADYKYSKDKPLEVRHEDGKFHPLGSDWVWFRIFRPDPSDRFAAWSTHKAMLDLLESMYVHQLADTVVGQSRLAGAGLLFIPNDEFMDGPDMDGGEPEPGTQAHFEMRLRSAMSDSIRDRKAQDAIVPLIMFGSAELADGIRHVLMERKDDAEAFASRMAAMAGRYGDGIDLPKEVVTSLGDANHWGAWKVDQNTWQYYLQPLAQIAIDALTTNFIRPIVEGIGSTAKLTATADATRVIVKPDRTDAGIRLHALNALNAEAALAAAGFDPVADLHPLANQQANPSLGTQPDGAVRMPGANNRGTEGEPVGDRNFQR